MFDVHYSPSALPRPGQHVYSMYVVCYIAWIIAFNVLLTKSKSRLYNHKCTFIKENQTKLGLAFTNFFKLKLDFLNHLYKTPICLWFCEVISNKGFHIVLENSYLFELLLETPVLLGAEILLNGTAALLRWGGSWLRRWTGWGTWGGHRGWGGQTPTEWWKGGVRGLEASHAHQGGCCEGYAALACCKACQ